MKTEMVQGDKRMLRLKIEVRAKLIAFKPLRRPKETVWPTSLEKELLKYYKTRKSDTIR